MGTKYVSY